MTDTTQVQNFTVAQPFLTAGNFHYTAEVRPLPLLAGQCNLRITTRWDGARNPQEERVALSLTLSWEELAELEAVLCRALLASQIDGPADGAERTPSTHACDRAEHREPLQLNGKPGALALVIHEEAGCEANVGRLVRLQQTLRETPWGLMWHAQPQGDPLWVCVDSDGVPQAIDSNASKVYVPDAFLVLLGEAPDR
ncbi:MAG: hypothetical protein ACK5OA_02685 [Acidovorax sp.]|jgi:hypothetical protein